MSEVTPLQFGEKYILLDRIGAGGVAEVFRGKLTRDQGFEKLIVIKKLLAEHNRNREMIDIFIREARLAALLEHDNIAATYDFGEIDGEYFLAMEYLFGKNLHAVMGRAGEHPDMFGLAEALTVCAKICEGMDYAHNLSDLQNKPLNLVHRDLTPHNIFITYDGKVKILDFGVAKAELFDNKTREGVVKGKISYMSPERLSGESVDRRSDIFSIGILLYEMITKRRMYQGDTAELIRKCLTADYDSLQLLMPELEPEVHEVLDRALAVGLDDRYQSCGEMLGDIDDLLLDMQQRSSSRLLKESVRSLFAEEFEVEQQKVGDVLHAAERAVSNRDEDGRTRDMARADRTTAAADKTTLLLHRPPQQVALLYGARVGDWIRQRYQHLKALVDRGGSRALYLGVCAVLLLLAGAGLTLLSGGDNDASDTASNRENGRRLVAEPAGPESAEDIVKQPSEESAGNRSEDGPAAAAIAAADGTRENETAQPAAEQPETEAMGNAGERDGAVDSSGVEAVVERATPVPVLRVKDLKIKKDISRRPDTVVHSSDRQVPVPAVAVQGSSTFRLEQPSVSAPVDLREATLSFDEDKERLARRKKIEALHEKAKQAMQQGHLVKPEGQSAYGYYRDILTINPRDNGAADGLRLICDKYAELAETSLSEKRYAQADGYVKDGLKVIYDHARLLDIQERIERERREHVFELSEKARLCLDADKLSMPVNDSAYFYYHEIERIDPDNEIVARGYKKIADRYAQLADAAFSRFDYDAAADLVEKGLQLNPDHYYLLSLKDDLASSDLGRFGHSMKKKMNRLFSN